MNDNDELRVVVRTLLEANEDESAQHIASQLKSISQKVNAISKIKVGVGIDNKSVEAVHTDITKQISGMKIEPVNIGVKVTNDAKKMLREALQSNGIEASSSMMKAMTQNLNAMETKIRSIEAGFAKVGKHKERLIELQIDTIDKYNKEIRLVQQYDESGRKVSETFKTVRLNVEKLEKQEEAAARRNERDNQNRLNYVASTTRELEKLNALMRGEKGSYPLVNQTHIDEFNAELKKAQDAVGVLESKMGAATSEERREIDALTTSVQKMLEKFQAAEYIGTDFRPKDVYSLNTKFTEDLKAYETNLKSNGLLTEEFQKKIEALRAQLENAFDSKSLNAYQNALSQLKSEVGSFQEAQNLQNVIAGINADMAVMPTKVSDIEQRFRNILQPTASLKANMEQLRTLTDEVNREDDANKKVEAYGRLQKTLKLVNTELSALTRMQNQGFRDDKLVTNLEKAKADLLTVGRTWSALKRDRGLNTQFEKLSANLAKVQTQADLSKWRAQFSAFKSEVKAAGKNVQAIGDILKNNLGKVLQWVSATTLLFRAFRYLRQGITTIIELDTAMIDLRKVTTATTEEYREFYKAANDTAKRLNLTTEAVISQTAEWARLGYAMRDAARLAENSAVFAAVSPGMEQTMATDGLVSIIKAYGVDVNDTMDGIISKINEVGNKFAVSNKDIVEAMTRSSSAMAAANNTFEETVALATAAIEITRDAATVGNGLKTLSMRIRGYDEETEEYSEDVAILTGKIADLTKTTSNISGVSLFEVGDPNTYRSTYDILKDIADIWDEITDKNRAELLEALFGKRQAQIGAAILSNFSQAEDAMVKMENAAGSADREMEKIMDSVEYRLNALKETWVGVAQNLFETDDMKAVIAILQAVSDTIEHLTDKLGLAGTVSIGGFVMAFNQLRKSAELFRTTIIPVVNTLNSIDVTNATDGFLQYTAALNGLDKTQTRVALSQSELTAQERAYVLQLHQGMAVLEERTVAQIAEAAGIDAVKLAESLKLGVDEQMNAAMLEQLVLEGSLDAASKQKLINLIAQTGATVGAKTATDALNFSLKESIALMLATPMGWISLLIALLPLAIKGVKALVDYFNEMNPPLEKLQENVNGLQEEADDLSKTMEENQKRIDELNEIEHPSLVDEAELNRLKRENELLEQQLKLQQELIAAENQKVTEKASKDAGKWLSNADQLTYTVNYGQGVRGEAADMTGAAGIINATKQYASAKAAYEQAVMDGNKDLAESYKTQLDTARTAMERLQNEAIELRNALDTDANAGNEEIQEQIRQLDELLDRAGLIIGTESALKNIADRFFKSEDDLTPENIAAFQQYLSDMGYTAEITEDQLRALFQTAEEGAAEVVAKMEEIASLKDLTDSVNSLNSFIVSAQAEMLHDGQVSADTIAKLSELTENYADYLYEENGELKINIDLLRELSNSKVTDETDKIQRENQEYEKQNELLREKIADYEEQRKLGNDGGIWNNLIAQTTAEINKNNEAIEANLDLLRQYEAIGNPWEDVFSVFDGYTAAMQDLASIQETVAESLTISAEKAREFAAIYPEILEQAEIAADGQLTLNADVVNGFLEGKEAELKAAIEAEVAKLEAEKSVLEAKKASAEAQLELAKNIGDGEGQITKELAEYRINAGNAVAQAMIDADMDEATAFRLAAAAMAQNAEEFDRVAMEVCTDVNGNFNQAAYDLAKTMYNNLTNVKTDLASVALQAQDTARAIAGIADGTVKGSSAVRGGSGGGVSGSGIKLNLQSGSFDGTSYTYTAKQSSLEDYVAELELDVTKYTQAIATIDSQISVLRALGNKKIKDFSPSSSGKSSGSKGSSSNAKEVEEYIATIDDYREALKRLAEAQEKTAKIQKQIEDSSDLKEQIWLQRQLTNAYVEQQAALHNLNNQRDSTIHAGVNALRELGFEVSYNDETNKLWIANMEHLNELTAESKGEYETLQEATNALRKETESLIESITDLNEANKDSSQEWWDLSDAMVEAKKRVHELLAEIVKQASEAVDEIQSVYDALHRAADEYAESGFVTVDTLQSIIALGAQYLKYLMDENGQLVINEATIRDVIAAKTEEMAVETALSYIESVRIAYMDHNEQQLRELTTTTIEATDATWNLVYAQAALLRQQGLGDEYYNGMMNVIDSLRTIADNAKEHIGDTTQSVREALEKTKKELEDMKSGLEDLIKYVMDMLKQRIQDQIDALNEMKTTYAEIIDEQKEMLRQSKKQDDYNKSLNAKLKEAAKLQAQIDALRLDTSRDSTAKRLKLEEDLAELQDDIAEQQRDHAIEATEDSLDKQQKAYEAEKDAEIQILEDSISSYQKLYDMAIDYISNHWDTLYNELISWNTEYGSVLNSEITSAWENALAAAQRYGDYVSALQNIDADIAATQSQIDSLGSGDGTHYSLGPVKHDHTTDDESMARAWVDQMKRNSLAWHTANDNEKSRLAAENKRIANEELPKCGVDAYIDEKTGVWYLRGGGRLYDVYHKGGVVGGGSIKENEQLALLKNNEWVLSDKMVDTVSTMIQRLSALRGVGSDSAMNAMRVFTDALKPGETVNSVTNANRNVTLSIGDTIINGGSAETVRAHQEVSRQQANDILKFLNIHRQDLF